MTPKEHQTITPNIQMNSAAHLRTEPRSASNIPPNNRNAMTLPQPATSRSHPDFIPVDPIHSSLASVVTAFRGLGLTAALSCSTYCSAELAPRSYCSTHALP